VNALSVVIYVKKRKKIGVQPVNSHTPIYALKKKKKRPQFSQRGQHHPAPVSTASEGSLLGKKNDLASSYQKPKKM